MAASKDSQRIPLPPAEGPFAPGGPEAVEAVNPAALSVAQVARMLCVPPEKVQEHVAAGAQTGPDGTINLVHYAAWLNRELARPEPACGEPAEPAEGTRTDGD